MGLVQSQSPYFSSLTAIYLITFVHGLIVGPTPNPLSSVLFRIMRLRRKDFPVLYLPATAMTPILSLMLLNSSAASALIWKPTGSKEDVIASLPLY